jgi:multidrug efflux pump subunit AcrB
VVNAVNAQNLILPSGTAKIGATNIHVDMNGSPDHRRPQRLSGAHAQRRHHLPAEVAHVRDGFSPQTNIVRQNGIAAC